MQNVDSDREIMLNCEEKRELVTASYEMQCMLQRTQIIFCKFLNCFSLRNLWVIPDVRTVYQVMGKGMVIPRSSLQAWKPVMVDKIYIVLNVIMLMGCRLRFECYMVYHTKLT